MEAEHETIRSSVNRVAIHTVQNIYLPAPPCIQRHMI